MAQHNSTLPQHRPHGSQIYQLWPHIALKKITWCCFPPRNFHGAMYNPPNNHANKDPIWTNKGMKWGYAPKIWNGCIWIMCGPRTCYGPYNLTHNNLMFVNSERVLVASTLFKHAHHFSSSTTDNVFELVNNLCGIQKWSILTWGNKSPKTFHRIAFTCLRTIRT